MEYTTIQGLNKPLSRIVLGCDTKPFKDGENLDDFLDSIFQLGINTFDSAHKYGLSEVSLGNWMEKAHNRDKVVIITKGCHPDLLGMISRLNPKTLREEIEESFKRLKTDYIDIYFLHRDDRKADLKGLLEVLNEYKEKGKIGVYGGSNWTGERINEANKISKDNGYAPFMVSSPNYSLARWEKDPWGGGEGCVSLHDPKKPEERDWYIKNDFPAFCYSALARGFMTGKVKTDDLNNTKSLIDLSSKRAYWSHKNLEILKRAETLSFKKGYTVSQIALAYLLNQPFKVFPIIGSTYLDRMKNNAEACHIKLSKEEIDYLDLKD